MSCNCNNIYPETDMKRWSVCQSLDILTNYYTKSEIDEKIDTISGGAITSGEVQTMIDASVSPIEGDITALNGQVEQLSTSLENKADKSDIPSLEGYATQQWVEGKNYLTEQSLADYATKQEVIDNEYTISQAINDLNDKKVSADNLKTVNGISLIGEGDIQISGGTADLSNYYNKTEVNSLLADKLDASAYTPTDLSQYWTSGETQEAINAATSGIPSSQTIEGLRNDVNALSGDVSNLYDTKLDASAYTPTDLSNYYTKNQIDGFLDNAQTIINSKADASNVYNKTEVNNIVNNKFWCGTQAEYEALTNKDNGILYLIHE